MVAGGDGSISSYIHKWGQGTPEGGTTRSVMKLMKEWPFKALPESFPRRFQWEREG
jgi:hypothetical protein